MTIRQHGFTLTELMIVLVVAGLLAAVAVPSYTQYVDRARVSRAISDISALHLAIERYRLRHDTMPPSLASLGIDVPLDPWNQPYRFVDLDFGRNIGKARKDGRLVPLNSDFDLYSIGEDGRTATPLSARSSHDDILRANNGAFIGLGRDY